ncbi:MAG: hypothetical protein Q8S73_43115 [Deltaproteobacteria bacterium]|nr:hypothetical protein [Myxococcales bacterium]MDP3220954.1 hypothetical protein [Deltaproteobacteria bacterium]
MADYGPNNERLKRLLETILRTDFGEDQQRAAEVLGVSQPMISLAVNGHKPVGPKLKKGLATYTRQTLDELEGIDRPGSTRWRNLPGWADAERKAREMFPKVSPLAFDRLGNLMGEQPPSVSALTIGLLASTWDSTSTDEARIEAIATNARREMAEEDTAADLAIKRRHEARERGEPLPPLPGEPVKPRPRKPPPKPSRG